MLGDYFMYCKNKRIKSCLSISTSLKDATEQLFDTEVSIFSAALKTEKDDINFTQKVSSELYEGRSI